MYSAISGLRNHQIMLDVTANALANVNTVGFKASRTSFSDSLAQLQRSGASATTGNAGAKSAQIGLGVQLGSIDNLMTNGAFQSTGGPYDVAITGTGWFRVSNTDPTPGAPATRRPSRTSTTEYTRAGNFTLNDQGELTTRTVARRRQGRRPHHGAPTHGHRHQGPAGATDVSIGPNGAVTYTPSGGGPATAGYLSLASFPTRRASTASRPTAGRPRPAPARLSHPGNNGSARRSAASSR
jgi:flagellar hook protein FlgE